MNCTGTSHLSRTQGSRHHATPKKRLTGQAVAGGERTLFRCNLATEKCFDIIDENSVPTLALAFATPHVPGMRQMQKAPSPITDN
jgi:hypothetical protein